MKERFRCTTPIIVCECGKEILIIPDLKEMVDCIEEHVRLHVQKEIDPLKKQTVHDRIVEQLSKKVIIEVAKTSITKSRQ